MKRLNSAIHAPLKKMPPTESEPTISDVMNVLLDQGRKMATKQDLHELKTEILLDSKIEIAQAVDPLKEEVFELKNRVTKLESSAPSSSSSGTANRQLLELQKLVQECDPALKRVAFTGWSATVSPEERLRKITEFVSLHSKDLRIADTGNFYSGPHHDRKITKASFAEFTSSDAAKSVINNLRDVTFKVQDATITMKHARTKLNGKRNYCERQRSCSSLMPKLLVAM